MRSLQQQLRDYEIKAIMTALELNGNNRAAAARELGMNRTTLTEKMTRYKLHDDFPPPIKCKGCQRMTQEIRELKIKINQLESGNEQGKA